MKTAKACWRSEAARTWLDLYKAETRPPKSGKISSRTWPCDSSDRSSTSRRFCWASRAQIPPTPAASRIGTPSRRTRLSSAPSGSRRPGPSSSLQARRTSSQRSSCLSGPTGRRLSSTRISTRRRGRAKSFPPGSKMLPCLRRSAMPSRRGKRRRRRGQRRSSVACRWSTCRPTSSRWRSSGEVLHASVA